MSKSIQSGAGSVASNHRRRMHGLLLVVPVSDRSAVRAWVFVRLVKVEDVVGILDEGLAMNSDFGEPVFTSDGELIPRRQTTCPSGTLECSPLTFA